MTVNNLKLNLKWVSDVIGDDYLKWEKGDIVTINAQTGTGKTYFVIEKLFSTLNSDEKAIYICNRTELKRQIKIELFKKYNVDIKQFCKYEDGKICIDMEKVDKIETIGNITVKSYQSIIKNVLNAKYLDDVEEIDLNQYKYIILDECQFFLIDADFNQGTLFAFTKIIQYYYSNAIRIFISATMEEIEQPIINNMKRLNSYAIALINHYSYTTGKDYSYLNVKYFRKDNDLIQTIANNKDEKWIIFVSSISKGKLYQDELNKKNVSNSLITASTRSEDKDSITINSKFNSNVVITTKCLDNGINIKDDELCNVVIDSQNKITFIQELGRIRINIENPRKINLYIPTKSITTFLNRVNKIYQPKFDEVKLFFNDMKAFKSKYNADIKNIYNDLFYLDKYNDWKFNAIGYKRLLIDDEFSKLMIDEMRKDNLALIKQQLKWLEIPFTDDIEFIENVSDNEEVETLVDWLENAIGKRLYKEEQQELSNLIIKELTTIGNNVDYRTKLLKPSTIESILREQLNLPYAISEKGNNVNPNTGKKQRWIMFGRIIDKQ